MSTTFTRPNMVIPLALSYQERGISGTQTTTTSGRDQRKVNSYYEVSRNAITGKSSVNLTKRPGFSVGDPFGSADNVQYLITTAPGTTAANQFAPSNAWVFSKNGNISRVSSTVATTDILNDATYSPAYSDHCLISGVDTVFLQLHKVSAVQRVFYSSAIATWTEISASAFTAIQHVGKMEHIDGYTLVMGSDNKIYNSNLNTLQTGYVNYITKEIKQDVPAGLAKYGRQILAFGDRTVEVFYNAGSVTGSPLKRLAPLAQSIGMGVLTQTLAGTPGFRQSYTVTGNRLFFVGRSGGGQASVGVWAYDGSRFEKVSTQFIDKIIEDQSVFGVETVSFLGNDAVAINLSSISSNPQYWLMFLPAWNEWFEWTSGSVQPVNNGALFLSRSGTTAPNAVSAIAASGGLSSAYFDVSAGGTFNMLTQFKVPQDDNALTPMAWAGVQADSISAGASASAGVYIQMYLSDNDGESFDSVPYQIDLRQRSKVVHRLGSYEDRWVRLVHSGNADCRIQKFIAKTL